jgi:hypothetical protein
MTTHDSDTPRTSRATQPLLELQEILQEARTSDDAERIHAALIEVVDQLITHAQKQAKAIEDLRSDVSHKQGIVTSIDGSDYKMRANTPASVQNNEANDPLDL